MQIFMIIDDSPVIRKVANRILQDMGFVVIEAEDGNEALNQCSHSMPDAIIVDWDMPTMTGIEFLQEFNLLEGAQSVKTLYCTSELMVPEMTKAKRAGATGFLMKPFDRRILEAKFHDVGIFPRSQAA